MIEGILGLFLYFPHDKREYIPAAISFFIFFVGAIVTWRLFIQSSKKEVEQNKGIERQIMEQMKKVKKEVK